MSTLQQTKPRCANQSITEESGRPGTLRSNVGCDAIDEPCTNSTAGLPAGEPQNFSHRNKRTSPLWVQCSMPVTCAAAAAAFAFMRFSFACGSIDARAGLPDDLFPAVLFLAEVGAEFRGRGPDRFDRSALHVFLH